jgi:hypothetical protein
MRGGGLRGGGEVSQKGICKNISLRGARKERGSFEDTGKD